MKKADINKETKRLRKLITNALEDWGAHFGEFHMATISISSIDAWDRKCAVEQANVYKLVNGMRDFQAEIRRQLRDESVRIQREEEDDE